MEHNANILPPPGRNSIDAESGDGSRLLPPSVLEVKAPESPPPRTPALGGDSLSGVPAPAATLSPQPQLDGATQSTSPNPASPSNNDLPPTSAVFPPSTPPPQPPTVQAGNPYADEGLPRFARNKPVLSTAVTGSLAGFALGLLFGSPSTGALVGGGLGAVVSSRDDEVGAKAREMGTEGLRKVNQLTHQLSETETGVKLRTNLADAVKKAEEMDANYQITSKGKRAVEKAVSATTELNRAYHIDDRIYTGSTKFAQTVMEKIKQTTPPPAVAEGITTARKAAGDLDTTLGVTDSLKRTVEKLKGELNVGVGGVEVVPPATPPSTAEGLPSSSPPPPPTVGV